MARGNNLSKVGKAAAGSAEVTVAPRTHEEFQPGAQYRFSVRLSGKLAAQYAEQARVRGLDVEDVLEQRLVQCVGHIAEKPLYFNDGERRKLDEVMDYNFSSAAQVLERLQNMTTVDVSGVHITFTPRQLERIHSRCFYGVTFEEKVKEMCMYGVNAMTGLV